MTRSDIKVLLEDYIHRYNRRAFIKDDPISVPHRFEKKQDIEIAAFWVAMLAWGQRKTIIAKANELMQLMGDSPHDFILHHKEKDRKAFLSFKHRTFQATDTLYFLAFLQFHYRVQSSLEAAFTKGMEKEGATIEDALCGFHDYFFSLEYAPQRTRKHVATPARKSACKRLNMFLRWMVRKDDRGVDFGLWKGISPAQLMIPLDVHVARVAKELGILKRKQNDWKAVVELTEVLRSFDREDPVKYDFALFGHGVLEKKSGIL